MKIISETLNYFQTQLFIAINRLKKKIKTCILVLHGISL